MNKCPNCSKKTLKCKKPKKAKFLFDKETGERVEHTKRRPWKDTEFELEGYENDCECSNCGYIDIGFKGVVTPSFVKTRQE